MLFKDLLVPYSCLNCGSAYVQNTRFCRPCFELMFQNFQEMKTQLNSGIKTIHLLNWIPDQSDSLSRLHLELKNAHPQIWKWLGQKLSKNLIHQNLDILRKGDPIVISLRSSPGYNHSESWGEAISNELGLNHVTGLEKMESQGFRREQKNYNIYERQTLKLKACVDLTKLRDRPMVFADDILTTGATLKEAYRTLGEPRHFIGIFVSHRKLH
jgi:predicted amidophosphoribosyltransferase